MIRVKYIDRIHLFRAKLYLQQKKSRLYLAGKLVTFPLIVVMIYHLLGTSSLLNFILLISFIVSYIIFIVVDERCSRQIKRLQRMIGVCEREVSYLDGNYSCFESGSKYTNLSHEFSYDLDIFGKSSLYNRINRSITERGSDYLASKLQSVFVDKNEIADNSEAIKELKSLSDWRIEFMSHTKVQSNLELLSLSLQGNKIGEGRLFKTLPIISVGLTLLLLLLALFSVCSWSLFTAMFTLQLFAVILSSKTTQQITTNADKLCKEYKGYLVVLEDVSKVDFKSRKLSALKSELLESEMNCFKAFKKISSILNMLDQRSNVIVYIVTNGLYMSDILLTMSYADWMQKYMPHIKKWVDLIGELDALVSLSTYAYNTPTNCVAEVLSDDSSDIIVAESLYHPFIDYNKAVANDFTLSRSNISIVTGANMAGKSTFLRTLGVNYILAANGVPVCAKQFKFSIVSLFSSMRTTDDLSNAISYFNAELLRLKQLLLHCKSHSYTLIILDEILKGTNSRDKLKGSIMFLEELVKHPISGVIATHDLELSRMQDLNNEQYTNYCFEIELSEDIQYTYKIERGVAQNLNATYLLSNILKNV